MMSHVEFKFMFYGFGFIELILNLLAHAEQKGMTQLFFIAGNTQIHKHTADLKCDWVALQFSTTHRVFYMQA